MYLKVHIKMMLSNSPPARCHVRHEGVKGGYGDSLLPPWDVYEKTSNSTSPPGATVAISDVLG